MKRLSLKRLTRAVRLVALLSLPTFWLAQYTRAQAPEPGVLYGHEGAVVMGVFTPDGERVVTASSDQTARVWDVAKSVELRRHTQHTGPLYCLAVSGDGRTLVTGAQDNTLRTWDLPLSKPIRTFAEHATPVRGFVLNPDGLSLLSVADDKNFRIHDLLLAKPSAPAPVPTIIRPGHPAEVLSLATRTDGAIFCTADASGRILLWSPDLDTPQGRLFGHAGRVTSTAVHTNNQQLYTTGDDGVLRIWQLTPMLPKELGTAPAAPIEFTMIPGQNNALWSLADGTMRLIDMATGMATRELPKFVGKLIGHTISPNAAWLTAWADDGSVNVLNLADGTPRGRAAGHTGPVTDVAIHADATRYATSGKDGTVRFWQQPLPAIDIKGHTGPLRGLLSFTSGQRLATISEDMTTRLWTSNAPTQQAAYANHEQPLRAFALRDDDGLLATGDASGVVWVWNVGSGAAEGYLAAHAGAITALEFSSDRNSLVTAGADGVIRSWTFPLPKQKPAAGEEAPKPAWEFPVPGAPAIQLKRVSQEQGLLVLPNAGQAILRLKWDGTAGAPINTPGRPLKSLELFADAAQLASLDDQGGYHVWKLDGTLVKSTPFGVGITSARLSKDGLLVALCDNKPRVRIAALATGIVHEEIATLFPVTDSAWTGADQRSLALMGPGNDVVVVQRTLLRMWDSVPGGVNALAMTPDQQFILAASGDGKVRQWNLADGMLTKTLDAPATPLLKMALSTNGQFVAAIGEDKQLHLWSFGDGKLLRSIPHPQPLRSVTLTADGARAATAGADGIIRVWEVATGQLLESFADHVGPIVTARYMADGVTLVSTGEDKLLKSVKTSITRAWPIHKGPVRDMVLYQGGAQTISCGDDGLVLMTEVSNGTVSRTFKGGVMGGEFKPTVVAVRPDAQRIAAGTETGEVLIWNVNAPDEPMQRLKVADVAPTAITALQWSPDQQKLAVATAGKTVHVFGPSLPNLQPALELTPHQSFPVEGLVTEVQFAVDNRSVWLALSTGKIEEWTYAGPAATRQFNHGGPVYGVAVTRDGRTVVSTSTDQTVRVWDVTTGQQKFQLNGHTGAVHAVALSPDETFAITSGSDGTLRLWDIVGGRQLKQLTRYDATMYSVAIHPNGQLLAAAGADRKVHLVDIISGSEQRILEGHTDYIHSVTFNPVGDRVLSYGYAGHLKVWNMADGGKLTEQRIGRVGNAAHYSPDGKKLVLANGDGTARVIPSGQ